ncbi:MAG: glycerol-3-phosphate dehydrogenase/oxidase [Polaromonas sp.]|nr:glycerol-3-phosphate dehydrogenase/oxidase [Polaromonas sp.]
MSNAAELPPAPTVRAELIARLASGGRYDLAVIGGGATGLGVALDAANRGLSVVLVESHDFAKGSSSRATKLVHGGVRYLAQGNISLVREALHERSTLLANAPHLAQPLPFVMPSYKFWEAPFYGVGLKMYDALAGKAGLGPTEFLNAGETRALLPTVRSQGLRGGVKYWDGQFDDARLALALARTAAQKGALLVNYCAVTGLLHDCGKLVGLRVQDRETGRHMEIRTGCVVNAAGVWVDQLRFQDGEGAGHHASPMVAPSQGVHIVVDRDFLPTDHAMLIPRTGDGRVLFAVPWLGKTILGTTDTPRSDLAREPLPFREEVDFILNESALYLSRQPRANDVRSIWVGLRPLVKPPDEAVESTQSLSREHTVLVSKSGLVTVTGGKWTTYRAMAEDVMDRCFSAGLLPAQRGGSTAKLRLVGACPSHHKISDPPGLHLYGSESSLVQSLAGSARHLGGGLTEAMVRFAARYEYARTVEDVLARRSRLLFLNASLAQSLAKEVDAILRAENGTPENTADFVALCTQYHTLPG